MPGLRDMTREIQRCVGVSADGAYGPNTARAIMDKLGLTIKAKPVAPAGKTGMTITEDSLESIVSFECGGKAYFEKMYKRCSWPGGASGPTFGVGWDAGYNTSAKAMEVWEPIIGTARAKRIAAACGVKGTKAKAIYRNFRDFEISYEEAMQAFLADSVPRFARLTVKTFSDITNCHPVCQAGLLSMVFNRGNKVSGNRRRHMKAIQDNTTNENIIKQCEASKVIWPKFKGLLNRRDKEVKMMRNRANDRSPHISI
jgi:hypothetical protein